jgi:hypothetical protein
MKMKNAGIGAVMSRRKFDSLIGSFLSVLSVALTWILHSIAGA